MARINDTIARVMREWDDEHYPRLLEATWGWHPFYVSFISNPLNATFRPSYPLHHSVVEGCNVHALLLKQSHVQRCFPVPWCVLLIRCFLKFHSLLPPLVSHPHSGGTDNNVEGWLSLTKDLDGSGSRTWHLAKTYLRDEGFLMFAGARSVDSQHDWEAEVEDAWSHLLNPTPDWWAELRGWCNSTQLRAMQDMAFHDKQVWLNVWVTRDRPTTTSHDLACYDRWLRYREDLDIGYILAKPGNFYHHLLLTCCSLCTLIPVSVTLVHVVIGVMVPSLERGEFLDDLRNLADNIVGNRLDHSEVLPLAQTEPPTDAASCEMVESHPQTPTGIGTSAKDGEPFLETHSADVTTDGHVEVRPAFDIPMTQAKGLEDLPSQLDFDWQDSPSTNPPPVVGVARNLDGELVNVGTPRSDAVPIHVGTDTFTEVSQITQEAAKDATPQAPAEVDTPMAATPDVIDGDASRI